MLDGEIAYRRGEYDDAFARLRRSIELDDALPYDEPWGWMQPTRHAFGALLLEQGHVEEAAAVYRADLGLDGTLRARAATRRTSGACTATTSAWPGSGRDEAAAVKVDLDAAQALTDVPVVASCACRTVA